MAETMEQPAAATPGQSTGEFQMGRVTADELAKMAQREAEDALAGMNPEAMDLPPQTQPVVEQTPVEVPAASPAEVAPAEPVAVPVVPVATPLPPAESRPALAPAPAEAPLPAAVEQPSGELEPATPTAPPVIPTETAPAVPTPPAEAPGQSPAEERIQLHVGATNENRALAMDAANRKLEAKLSDTSGNFAKRWGRRVWYGNLGREYMQTKYMHEALEQINDSGNLYAAEGKGKEASDKAWEDTFKRFSSEFEDEMVHEDAGESKNKLWETEAGRHVSGEVKELVKEYLAGRVAKEDLDTECKRIMDPLTSAMPELAKDGMMYASNLVEAARQIQIRVQEGKDLDAVLEQADIYFDIAKMGARSEAKYNSVEKLVDKVQHSKLGPFVNETALIGGISLAYSVGQLAMRKGATATRVLTGGLGIASGALAGFRENKRIKEERAIDARAAAQGREYTDEARGRRLRGMELEKSRYEAKSATELVDQLDAMFYEKDADGNLSLRPWKGETQDEKQADFGNQMALLAEVKARIQRSDRENIDLISYSSAENVSSERMALDLKYAEIYHTVLKDAEDSGFKDRVLGIFNTELSANNSTLEKHEKEQDHRFNVMRAKKVAFRIATTTALSLVMGATAQEAMAGLSLTNAQGYVEGLLGHHDGSANAHDTLLNSRFGSHEAHEGLMGGKGPMETIGVGPNQEVKVPDGFQLEENMDHSYALIGANHHTIANGLKFPDGTPDTNTASLLKENHVGFNVNHFATTGTPVENTQTMGVHEYLERNAGSVKHVNRIGWADENTSAPVFEDNEQKLDWGGLNGTGLDAAGNIHMNVSQMSPDGSFHQNFSTNAQEMMREGKLKLLVSASKDSQSTPIQVPIGPNGDIQMTPEARPFFNVVDGHAQLNAAYAEVAYVDNTDAAGTENVWVLATATGPGSETVQATVIDHAPVSHTVTTLIAPPQHAVPVASPDRPVDVPPVLPIYGRRGIGETEEKGRDGEPANGQDVEPGGITPELPPAEPTSEEPTVITPDPDPIRPIEPAPGPATEPAPEPPVGPAVEPAPRPRELEVGPRGRRQMEISERLRRQQRDVQESREAGPRFEAGGEVTVLEPISRREADELVTKAKTGAQEVINELRERGLLIELGEGEQVRVIGREAGRVYRAAIEEIERGERRRPANGGDDNGAKAAAPSQQGPQLSPEQMKEVRDRLETGLLASRARRDVFRVAESAVNQGLLGKRGLENESTPPWKQYFPLDEDGPSARFYRTLIDQDQDVVAMDHVGKHIDKINSNDFSSESVEQIIGLKDRIIGRKDDWTKADIELFLETEPSTKLIREFRSLLVRDGEVLMEETEDKTGEPEYGFPENRVVYRGDGELGTYALERFSAVIEAEKEARRKKAQTRAGGNRKSTARRGREPKGRQASAGGEPTISLDNAAA